MSETTTQQLLRDASHLLGAEELAVALGVPRSLLDAWISGDVSMPDGKLCLLTDLLVKAS
jgi:hypothetical protein